MYHVCIQVIAPPSPARGPEAGNPPIIQTLPDLHHPGVNQSIHARFYNRNEIFRYQIGNDRKKWIQDPIMISAGLSWTGFFTGSFAGSFTGSLWSVTFG